MTTPATTPATLEEIRQSFLQAESTLSDLADALMSLRSSSEQLDDARGGLQNASQQILDLAGQVAATAQGISASIELLREGVGALEKSEPTRMLSALDQLSGVVDRTSTTLRASIDSLAQGIPETLREAVEGSAAALGVELTRLHGLVEGMDARGAARVDALASTLAEAGMAQAASLAEITRAVQDLSKELSAQRTAIGQTKSDVTARQKWILLAITGVGAVIASLQLWQLLR